MNVFQSLKVGSFPQFLIETIVKPNTNRSSADIVYNSNCDSKYPIMVCQEFESEGTNYKWLIPMTKSYNWDDLVGWSSNLQIYADSYPDDVTESEYYVVVEQTKIHIISVHKKYEIMISGNDPENKYFKMFSTPQIPEDEYIGKVNPVKVAADGFRFMVGKRLIYYPASIDNSQRAQIQTSSSYGTFSLNYYSSTCFEPAEIDVPLIYDTLTTITAQLTLISEQLSKVSKYFITR